MRSSDIDVLQLLANAASDWRVAALSQGVELDVMVVRISGEIVFLRWDAELAIWDIRTAQSTFTARYVPNETEPTLSRWDIVAQ